MNDWLNLSGFWPSSTWCERAHEASTYQQHARHKHHKCLAVTGRLRVARVDLVLDLLKGEALQLAARSRHTYDELLDDRLRALRLRALKRQHGLRALFRSVIQEPT